MKTNARRFSRRVFALLLIALAPPVTAQTTRSTSQALVQSSGAQLWTKNANRIPLCWHQMVNFPTATDVATAQAFVRETLENGWAGAINIKLSWESCPTSGTAKHVRVFLRTGDAGPNGTTIKVGMQTLTTAADRIPPKDPAGLLMGMPANWNQDAATREDFRNLILHEFGHILGFDHEYVRTDGPAGVSCYNNTLGGAIPLGPPDPQSIMGWSYCAETAGGLTRRDVAAARSIYGAPATELVQLHADGSMWIYTNTPCGPGGCFGWAKIDQNSQTVEITTGYDGMLYQRHRSGAIWAWDGFTRCNQDVCRGWTELDRNSATTKVVGGGSSLFQLHANGEIYRYTGVPCSASGCPGWTLVDRNADTREIVAVRSTLFQRHASGKLWKWDGHTSCTASACPGWAMVDNNPATVSINGGFRGFYQMHSDHKVWRYTDRVCAQSQCPGWELIDRNPATASLASAGAVLFQRHSNGWLWRWDGSSRCNTSGCPGWLLIDRNGATADVAYGGRALYQRHANGWLWVWDGSSRCDAVQCPGWTVIDRNSATTQIVAFQSKF